MKWTSLKKWIHVTKIDTTRIVLLFNGLITLFLSKTSVYSIVNFNFILNFTSRGIGSDRKASIYQVPVLDLSIGIPFTKIDLTISIEIPITKRVSEFDNFVIVDGLSHGKSAEEIAEFNGYRLEEVKDYINTIQTTK